MPETVETPVPSACESLVVSVWARLRVSVSEPMASFRVPESESVVPASSESVLRALEMASRVPEMEPCASERSCASPESEDWVSRSSPTMLALALSTLPTASDTPCWSFSDTVEPTTLTNCSAICCSSVVAPVSVTLGEMALTFSLT